jgi:hypothetical protein
MHVALRVLCLCTAGLLPGLAHAAPAADPCRESNLRELQAHFGYLDAEGMPTTPTQVACKALPDAPGTAAVAVFHRVSTFEQDDSENALQGNYDLHVFLADAAGQVLAEGRVHDAATYDAVELGYVSVDTGRYHLAPGVRAFGVGKRYLGHCHDCLYEEGHLDLFVREGAVLRRVLPELPQSLRNVDAGAPGCTSASFTTERTLAIGRDRHAGFADLVVTATTTRDPGYDGKDQPCAALPVERQTETWIYDGTRYVAPAVGKPAG